MKNKEFNLRSTAFVSWKRREKGLRKGRSSLPLWESGIPKNGKKENPRNIKKQKYIYAKGNFVILRSRQAEARWALSNPISTRT